MIFTAIFIVLCVCLLAALAGLVLAVAALLRGRVTYSGSWGACGGFALVISFFPLMLVGGVWGEHAKDLGTISAQTQLIQVMEERVASLDARLAAIDAPQTALMNADSPVAALVVALSDAEEALARVKLTRAEAIRSIERRRAGPMSGVIWLAGDYEREDAA